MNNYNVFDRLIAIDFSRSLQLGGIGPKGQELVIPFHLGEGENIS